jgi:hypothetical protein
MGEDKWAEVIEYLKNSNRDPKKVLKLLKKQEKGSNKDSLYQIFRGSWCHAVINAIHNKIGTPEDGKKRTQVAIMRNWCKSEDYKIEYMQWHPGKDNPMHEFSGPHHLNMYEKNVSLEKKVKRVKDIWTSKNYKYLRELLVENDGKIPISNSELNKYAYINKNWVSKKDQRKFSKNFKNKK